MQQVTTALSTATLGSLTDPPASLPIEWIERIFLRLSAQLGAKVADLYAGVPPDAVKAEWGMALADFRPEEIQRGLAACATRVFAPTLGEFARVCRPCLDPETAFYEAKEGLRARERGEVGVWSHPAVYRAARQRQWEIAHYPYDKLRKEWGLLLERELRAGWGEAVAAPLISIGYQPAPAPAPQRTTWDERVDEIREGRST